MTLTRGHLFRHPFETLQVFAWDEAANDYDTDESDGRSYISVVSEVITDSSQKCDGRAKKTMGEARMDIVNSEIGYLGYYASEAYGLTWKVRCRFIPRVFSFSIRSCVWITTDIAAAELRTTRTLQSYMSYSYVVSCRSDVSKSLVVGIPPGTLIFCRVPSRRARSLRE